LRPLWETDGRWNSVGEKDDSTKQLAVFFCPVLPNICKSVALFKGSLSQPACPSAKNSIMIPYLARLLDITINNGTIPRGLEKLIVVPIHKEGYLSVVKIIGLPV